MKIIDKIKVWFENRPHGGFFSPSCKYKHTDGGTFFSNTGKFIDGKPIQEKYEINIATCTKCGYTVKSEHKLNY